MRKAKAILSQKPRKSWVLFLELFIRRFGRQTIRQSAILARSKSVISTFLATPEGAYLITESAFQATGIEFAMRHPQPTKR